MMKGSAMRVILLGPPGSGKGTQGALLTETLNVPTISTGDLFRKNLAENTPLGQAAQGYMSKGELVPDGLVLDMVNDRLSEADAAAGFILDGFPRTIPQADGLQALLSERGEGLDHVVLVDVPDDVIVERLSARRTCSECGAIYNMLFSPPKRENICDKCGAENSLTQREDDEPGTIRQRLEVYHKQTKPLVDYYQKAGILQTLDGTQPPDQVAEAAIAVVSE
jgi:adenylate kinase